MMEFARPHLAGVAQVLALAAHTIAFTGAGISVESGIPPYRGPGGLWTRTGEPPMNLYQQFLANPRTWWERRLRGDDVRPEARSFDEATPNPGHSAMADLEARGLLKFLITQNVDNLHYEAGSRNLAEIHGNRRKLRCIACSARWFHADFSLNLDDLPPRCPHCDGVVKGDGVMFGEPIPRDVLAVCQQQAMLADCVLLVGTSGTVYPAAEVPLIAKRRGALLIEVNTEETRLTGQCDIVLRGPSSEILVALVDSVGYALGALPE